MLVFNWAWLFPAALLNFFLLTNSPIISNSKTFSPIFGMRDTFLGLILQIEVKNKVKNLGVNF